MTAFDRAFIKAYMPPDAQTQQEEAASPLSVAPVSSPEALDSLHEPESVSPTASPNRRSMLAAFEQQPFRATPAATPAVHATMSKTGENRSNPTVHPTVHATVQQPAAHPTASSILLHKTPSPHLAAEANPGNFSPIHHESQHHDSQPSHPASPTLSAFMRLHEVPPPSPADDTSELSMGAFEYPRGRGEASAPVASPDTSLLERHEEHHEAVVDQEQTPEDVADTVPAPLDPTDFERPSRDFRLDAPHTTSMNEPFMATRKPSSLSGDDSLLAARASKSSIGSAFATDSALSETALPQTIMSETDARSTTSPCPSTNAVSSKSYVPVEMPPVSMFSVFGGTEEQETQATESPFNPTWKVEQFTWPRVCRRLLAKAGEELDQLVDALLAIQEQGQKVLAISGWHGGEGATTLLLCAARRLAERGIKPVLIDADLIRPRLAKRLGVRPQISWNQAMAQGSQTSLDQAIVESEVHNIALATGCEPENPEDASSADRSRLPDCIASLRNHYDMVLVDLGPLEDANLQMESPNGEAFHGIDAMVLVRDQRLTSYEQMSEIQGQLRSAKVAVAGVVENFVDL